VITLVLGGMRSGKSEVAEQLAAAAGEPVTVVATARHPCDDADFAARIDRHRARRPSSWSTIEEPDDVTGAVATVGGTVLVDALGTWIANAPAFAVDIAGLCDALVGRSGATIVVSDEVGLSVHPPTDVGRRFADAVGDCNRAVAEIAGRVVLVIAGRTLELDGGTTDKGA
jgi:adenosyl cobinamide kinase/adenosyl cobinamide phosphate guanylyltransferase